jgi:hypothetical protein
MIKSRELPTASSEVKPNIRVAPDPPVGVGANDCVRSGAEDCLVKTVRYARGSVRLGAHHGVAFCKAIDLRMIA